jgi:hypothetical protein
VIDWRTTLISALVLAGLCGLTACNTRYRVQTHPTPDARLKAMRQTLERLQTTPETTNQPRQHGPIHKEGENR